MRDKQTVVVAPDGQTVLSTIYDLSGSPDVLKRDVATGKDLGKLGNGFTSRVAISPDSLTVLLVDVSGGMLLYDIKSGDLVRTFSKHPDYTAKNCMSVAFSPDGSIGVTSHGRNILKLWEIASGRELCTLEGHVGNANSVAFSPNRRIAVSAFEANTLKLFDTWGRVIRTFAGHTSKVKSVAFSLDGLKVLSLSEDGALKLWGIKLGTRNWQLSGHGRPCLFSSVFARWPDCCFGTSERLSNLVVYQKEYNS